MNEPTNPSELETWAIVEVMGHSKYAGFCRQVAMGGAAMIRVDVPALPEREVIDRDYDYDPETGRSEPVSKKRTIPAIPAFTKFLGINSIFAITPCTEELARAAVDSFRSPPATILVMPAQRALPAADGDGHQED